MRRTNRTPSTYRHRGHTIAALHSRICGPEGWLYWLVIPDNCESASWYARSLAEARKMIAMEVV